uniref:CX domain-containing protein n=1 Tax=Elaeophora elaphi TaxID=1147741 RepID=A0A0R3RW01_9BILA
MNRWEAYQHSPTAVLQNELTIQDSKVIIGHEVLQHATVGNFLGSSIEGSGSGFIRCVYTAKNAANATVTLLCDVDAGCCERGCCPQDLLWMAGVFILLVFVLLVFVIGACIVICCYWRTKSEQRREAYEYSIYDSQIGIYPDGYSSYMRPVYQRY